MSINVHLLQTLNSRKKGKLQLNCVDFKIKWKYNAKGMQWFRTINAYFLYLPLHTYLHYIFFVYLLDSQLVLLQNQNDLGLLVRICSTKINFNIFEFLLIYHICAFYERKSCKKLEPVIVKSSFYYIFLTELKSTQIKSVDMFEQLSVMFVGCYILVLLQASLASVEAL